MSIERVKEVLEVLRANGATLSGDHVRIEPLLADVTPTDFKGLPTVETLERVHQ